MYTRRASPWISGLCAKALEERALQHKPPRGPGDSWDLRGRIDTTPPPVTGPARSGGPRSDVFSEVRTSP